ncbi:MAG: CCA tRNA nucleotidyltransferase [Hyphomicrobiales bacterium]|nr:CCA tRNA nucleotidyltransferase [Hyphomicrobiales bacterium]
MSGLPGLQDGRLKDLSPLKKGALAQALAALNGGGEETRLVGGAVRDLVLGLEAGDLDLATTAPPRETMRRARAAGFKVAPTGLAHGTVTLVLDGERLETTTLREDVETDGRHAKVAFGRDFVADAARRDFTINALSLSADGQVHDAFGGLADLAAGRVRFIGDAKARIREDYLRILRFFRFSARFSEGALDREGLAAAISARSGLERLSRERVRSEALKLIVAPHAGAVVAAMGETGFLEPVLGGVAYPGRFKRAVAIESARKADPDPILRLAALAVAISENAWRLRERLRLSNPETRRVARAATALVRLRGIERPPPREGLEALLFRCKRRAARDALFLAQADSTAPPDDPAFAAADLFLAEAREPRLPVSGDELAARGLAEGPLIGAILRAFETLWVEAGFPGEREAVDRLLAKAVRDYGDGLPFGQKV